MINQSRLLSLFEQLISFDSPSFDERSICNFIKERLLKLGIIPQEDHAAAKIGGSCGNLYAFVNGTLRLPPLLFCSHMDTVEPALGKKMQTDKNGVITSKGNTILGADDCAGIAAILEALTALQQSDIPHRPLELLFTVAEEAYCKGIQEFDFTILKSRQAYVFDLTGPVGQAAYQAPTIISFEATVYGHAAHAGFSPEKGVHAIQVTAEAITQIPLGKNQDTAVNIGTILGGTTNNIVPDRCKITGEIRSYSNPKALKRLQQITNILYSTAKKYGAKVDIQSTRHCTAYLTNPEHPVVKRFENICIQLGLQSSLCKTFGGSDNNTLALHGVHGIVLATAMNNCHSCKEYTTEQELYRAASLAFSLMASEI